MVTAFLFSQPLYFFFPKSIIYSLSFGDKFKGTCFEEQGEMAALKHPTRIFSINCGMRISYEMSSFAPLL